MEIRVDTQSEAWVAVVAGLLSAPVVAPRGLKSREASEPTFVMIRRPQAGFVSARGRRLNHAITAAEGLSLVGQTSVPETLVDRVAAFGPFMNDGVLWGAYGPRIAGDLGQVVSLLKRDPDSRQAVITLFDSSRDLGRPEVRDVPCTVAIQFMIRGHRLNMWVVMRSNDAWLGLPYDLGQFSILQFAVAQALDVGVGHYVHSAGSMHLYERNWEEAGGVGDPASHPVGQTFGPSDDERQPFEIGAISLRARRILLGQESMVSPLSSLETWLSRQLSE